MAADVKNIAIALNKNKNKHRSGICIEGWGFSTNSRVLITLSAAVWNVNVPTFVLIDSGSGWGRLLVDVDYLGSMVGERLGGTGDVTITVTDPGGDAPPVDAAVYYYDAN